MTASVSRSSVGVRVAYASGWGEEDRDPPVRRVLVRGLQVKVRSREAFAQAAPQVVDRSVGQRDVCHHRGATSDLIAGPEARVDVDCLETLRVPGDSNGSVVFHGAILKAA